MALDNLIGQAETEEEEARIDWAAAIKKGKIQKELITPEKIERDFNDRLRLGEIADFRAYQVFVEAFSHHFHVELNRSAHALHRIESDYFKSIADSREPPQKMEDLLNSYLNELGDTEYTASSVLDDLEKTRQMEMKMNAGAGEYNPYR